MIPRTMHRSDPQQAERHDTSNQTCANAAVRLHAYLARHHLHGKALRGPDPGVRFNARFGRFIKSYASTISWRDAMAYAQTQKYWIAGNWRLSDSGLIDRVLAEHHAVAAAEFLVEAQTDEGYWPYPNREWGNKIATVEGTYAALGLLEAYQRTRRSAFLEAAVRWHDFAVREIGFQRAGHMLSLKYFGRCEGFVMIPNVSASALRSFALLSTVTGEDRYRDHCSGMVAWLNNVQTEEGELPYGVATPGNTARFNRFHFLCYQYNAFQLLNLAAYYRLTDDADILPVLQKLAPFVAGGLTSQGACRHDCHRQYPEVLYYSAAVSAALRAATELGLGDYRQPAERALCHVLSQQSRDGGFTYYSRYNYKILADRRSYPRYLAMILYFLSLASQGAASMSAPESSSPKLSTATM